MRYLHSTHTGLHPSFTMCCSSECLVCLKCLYIMLVYIVNRRGTRKVRDLWWLGLPPGVRGNVWMKAIGNELNISPGKHAVT